MKTDYVVEDIRKVVDRVNRYVERRVDGFPRVQYMAGHFVEVNSRIISKSKSPQRMDIFPLVALRLDTTPNVTQGLIKYDLNIALLMATKAEWDAEYRYKEMFPKYLTPLYVMFMRALKEVRLFCWEGEDIPHLPIERPYLQGSSNSNTFSEFVDAIELQNLKVNKTYGCMVAV